MIRLIFIAALCLLFSACSPEEEAKNSNVIRDEKRCSFLGNSADKIYCATTYTQVLVDPDYYAGRRIMISGWGYSDGEITLLFPSEDSLGAVESHASLLLDESGGPGKLSSYLAGRKHGAARVTVGGVLNFKSDHRYAGSRFGVLEETEYMK